MLCLKHKDPDRLCARVIRLIRLSLEEILNALTGKLSKHRLLLAAGLMLSLGHVQAQVARTPVEKVCRQLTDADPHSREFRSCCDLDGGTSRWVRRADGGSVDRVSVCAIWGIKPGAPEFSLTPPAQTDVSAKGIPTGRYTCQIGSPVEFTSSRYLAITSCGACSGKCGEVKAT